MRGFLNLKYGMQHGAHRLKSWIGLYKASLAYRPKLTFKYIGFMHEFWTFPTIKMAYARLQNYTKFGGWRKWNTSI